MHDLVNAKYPELTVASPIDGFNRLLKMTNQAQIMSFRRRIQCLPCGRGRMRVQGWAKEWSLGLEIFMQVKVLPPQLSR